MGMAEIQLTEVDHLNDGESDGVVSVQPTPVGSAANRVESRQSFDLSPGVGVGPHEPLTPPPPPPDNPLDRVRSNQSMSSDQAHNRWWER